jgi:hypothetical protein
MEEDFNAVRELINEKLEVISGGVDKKAEEEEFIQMIALRVAELMESNMELFFNHLYRMDVDERKVRMALSLHQDHDESVYVIIARLIYDRQKQRLESRKQFKQQDLDFWAED